ncbi:MAG: hypothetical protein AVDCRST_MAG72-204, partial [uncultured Nocardioidaceae bacterium]
DLVLRHRDRRAARRRGRGRERMGWLDGAGVRRPPGRSRPGGGTAHRRRPAPGPILDGVPRLPDVGGGRAAGPGMRRDGGRRGAGAL